MSASSRELPQPRPEKTLTFASPILLHQGELPFTYRTDERTTDQVRQALSDPEKRVERHVVSGGRFEYLGQSDFESSGEEGERVSGRYTFTSMGTTRTYTLRESGLVVPEATPTLEENQKESVPSSSSPLFGKTFQLSPVTYERILEIKRVEGLVRLETIPAGEMPVLTFAQISNRMKELPITPVGSDRFSRYPGRGSQIIFPVSDPYKQRNR